MEQRRINKKNQLNNELNNLRSSINRDEKTILNLRNSDFDISFINNKISKLKNNIVDKRKTIINLENEIEDINVGKCDDKINEEYIRSNKEVNIKKKEAELKRQLKQEQIKRDKEKMSRERDKNRERGEVRRKNYRDFKYFERLFFKKNSSLPNYMLKKLSNMPNNKGYIWKGIYCYGDLPSEDNDEVVMFERTNKETLLIHKYTKTEYILYKKEGNNRKKFVKKTNRKIFNSDKYSLGGYISTNI